MGTVSPAFKQLLVIESGLLFEANKMKNLLLLLAVATYVSAAVVPNPPGANHELSSVYRRNYDKREAAETREQTLERIRRLAPTLDDHQPTDWLQDLFLRQRLLAAQQNGPRVRVEDDSLAGCDPRFPC